MKNILRIVHTTAICLVLLFITGCVASKTYFHKSSPSIKMSETDFFNMRVELIKKNNFFSIFRVTIENKSDAEIGIDWNKSLYFHNNKNKGKFVFKDIEPSQVKEGTVPNSIIPPKSNFTLDIAPLSKIALAGRKEKIISKDSGLYAGMFPEGKNSVQLILTTKSQVFKKTVSFIIKKEVK